MKSYKLIFIHEAQIELNAEISHSLRKWGKYMPLNIEKN